jgi:hypothetical protein
MADRSGEIPDYSGADVLCIEAGEIHMSRLPIVTAVCLAAALACYAQDPDRRDRDRQGEFVQSIPAGTRIEIRTQDPIDVRDRSDGRIFNATVAEDVMGPSDRLLIPRGARAELIVQNVGDGEMAIDLDSVTVEGRRYMVSAETYRDSRPAGVGANKRTGEYVGGGALLGTILGAIAGGGKGPQSAQSREQRPAGPRKS